MAGAWNKRAAVIGSIGVVVVGIVTAGGSVAHSSPSRAPAARSHVRPATKGPSGTRGAFTAVTAVPHSKDVWSVGYLPTKYVTSFGHFEARRHDGHWQRLKPVNLGKPTNGGLLYTVAAASSKVVWVGGSRSYKHSIQDLPAIWRLHGKKFVLEKLPPMENGIASIASISASSPTNAWAVGVIYVLPAGALDAFHWNGKVWKPFPFPELGFDTTPLSVSVSSPTNAWATDGTNFFHWNGKAWAANGAAPASAQIRSIATSGPKLAYADGVIPNTATGGYKTVIMRYNGKSWSAVKLAKGTGQDQLRSVSIHGRSAWAVGSRLNVKKDVATPVILHTTGGVWKNQTKLGKDFTLSSVSAASAKRAYATGAGVHGGAAPVQDTFFAAYNGHSWKGAPSKF